MDIFSRYSKKYRALPFYQKTTTNFTKVQHETDVLNRRKQIVHRLQRLENGHQNLKADQKWPTQKSINQHIYHTHAAVPEIVIQPPTPKLSSRWSYTDSTPSPARPSPRTLKRLLLPSPSPRADFPYSISRSSEKAEKSFMESSFLYFQFLPYEIRLEIWELAAQRPKLIEAQFSSQFYSPTFVGPCTRGTPLLYACRESREVALCLDYHFLTPSQRDFGKKYVFSTPTCVS